MRTISVVLLVLGLGVFACGCKKRTNPTDSGEKESQTGAKTPGKRGTFTVGKTTTFVTGPVESSGHIDYAGALHQRLSKGVTAESNANVAIWKVVGPNPSENTKVPAGYFEKMGTSAPPATGDYFVSLKHYVQQKGGNPAAASDALKRFTEQPWTGNQDPTLNGWILANHKPLTALREAVTKTQYYNPLIPERGEKGSKGLFSSPMPGVMACREIAGAFAARAMLFLGNNQTEEAWLDLLACHRLARLVGRGGCLLEALVGMAIEQIACRGDIAFLDRAAPDAKTIEGCLKDLRALPPLPDVVEKIELERYMFLDTMMQLDAQGIGFLESQAGGAGGQHPLANLALEGIDWDPALENANKWFDKLVAAARAKDRAERVQKLNQFTSELTALKEKATDPTRLSQMLRDGNASAKAKGEAVGDVMISLGLPAAPKVMEASDRTIQTHENVITAFALAWYQRFNGRYPAKLADLAPTYLTQVPTDLFTGRDLIYQPSATGFVFYSVGVNGRDDGGRGYNSNPPGDDLVVRIPQFARP